MALTRFRWCGCSIVHVGVDQFNDITGFCVLTICTAALFPFLFVSLSLFLRSFDPIGGTIPISATILAIRHARHGSTGCRTLLVVHLLLHNSLADFTLYPHKVHNIVLGITKSRHKELVPKGSTIGFVVQ